MIKNIDQFIKFIKSKNVIILGILKQKIFR